MAMARDQPRLRGVDGFAGVGTFSDFMQKSGLDCGAFDSGTLDKSHDITRPPGDRSAVAMLVRCISGSLVLLGPPCKNFVGLSR
eukprot:8922673-Pyramimonas_sp.AAC.1